MVSNTSDKYTNHFIRVLLATVRYLGDCPCPRCGIKKDQISALGTMVDFQRRNHQRTDNGARLMRVDAARWAMFKSGNITNARVQRILKPWSEVPVQVC